MYLFVTATNITELEMAGHYPNVDNIVKVIPFKPQGYENVQAYGMVAESFVDAHELTEAQRIDVLRQSLIQMFNHGGYRTSDKTFCKQRHWLSVYRVAADEGFYYRG